MGRRVLIDGFAFNQHSHEGSDIYQFVIYGIIQLSINTPTKGVTADPPRWIAVSVPFNQHSHEGSDATR